MYSVLNRHCHVNELSSVARRIVVVTTASPSYMRRRYRNEITDGCELYFLITLSFRDVEELMLERHCPVVNADTEITTPKPEDITARCTGTGENLVVNISAPHGWKIKANNPSQTLTVENTEQDLSGEIDTTNQFLDTLRSVDWSTPDQVDIAATAQAPADWNSPYGTGRVYLSLHVDCS